MLTLANTLTGMTNTYNNTFTKAHQLASENASAAAWGYVPATFQTTTYSAANNLNQYVNITVGANPTVTVAYDANCNLTGDSVWTFAHDAQNMLRGATKSGVSASYQYDPLGRRQALTENGVTTTFLHDGQEEIAEYDGAAALLRRYVPGTGNDMPIAVVTASGGGNTHKYFHTNRQGSTIAMSGDSGAIAEGPYAYDAFGNGAPTTGVPFKFTGRRLDPGSGLYYYRARYYAPSLGRFLQSDPLGFAGGINLYDYTGGDPVNHTDPTGLVRLCAIGTDRLNHCVWADGDGDKNSHEEDDLDPVLKQKFERQFAGAILAGRDGRDIEYFGRPVVGNGSDNEKAAMRVTSQFVGEALARDHRGAWWYWQDSVKVIICCHYPAPFPYITPAARGDLNAGSPYGEGVGIKFYNGGPWLTVNAYEEPSELARLLVHEVFHHDRPQADFSWTEHAALDAAAVAFVKRQLLAGGGCSAVWLAGYQSCD